MEGHPGGSDNRTSGDTPSEPKSGPRPFGAQGPPRGWTPLPPGFGGSYSAVLSPASPRPAMVDPGRRSNSGLDVVGPEGRTSRRRSDDVSLRLPRQLVLSEDK